MWPQLVLTSWRTWGAESARVLCGRCWRCSPQCRSPGSITYVSLVMHGCIRRRKMVMPDCDLDNMCPTVPRHGPCLAHMAFCRILSTTSTLGKKTTARPSAIVYAPHTNEVGLHPYPVTDLASCNNLMTLPARFALRRGIQSVARVRNAAFLRNRCSCGGVAGAVLIGVGYCLVR